MKIFVVIPAFNEARNIGPLIQEVLKLNITGLEIVVVDDNSPDGTSEVVSGLQNKLPELHLICRKQLRGRGLAGIAGFKFALEKGADLIIEMDADFSHNPAYIPELIKHANEHSMVICSRFAAGSSNFRKNIFRNALTLLANFYIRRVLSLPVRDCTSGYRCFKRNVLETIDISRIISKGPSVVEELLYKTWLGGSSIKEIPTQFDNRRFGRSNFNLKIALGVFIMILRLRIKYGSKK